MEYYWDKIEMQNVPWLITTFCLISEFQISSRISETLGRGSSYPVESLSLDLSSSLQILVRGSWDQISGQRFHKIWSLNWQRKRKLMSLLYNYLGWLPNPVWYLSFRYPSAYLKLSAEDLDIQPRVWVWICRLALKSSVVVIGIDS